MSKDLDGNLELSPYRLIVEPACRYFLFNTMTNVVFIKKIMLIVLRNL